MIRKHAGILATFLAGAALLAGCGEDESAGKERKELVLGGTVPYTEMLEWAVQPTLEEMGYDVRIVEFSDYVQPNLSLDDGSLDANLYQHEVYLSAFTETRNMDLSLVIPVPTAPIGIYSEQYDSLGEIEEGSTIGLANDPTNLSRGLTVLRDAGLIEISEDADPIRASPADVTSNPLNLQFKEIEAANLPRSLDSLDLAAVNGNFALAGGMDLNDALVVDNMPPEIQNQIVVRTEDLDEQFVEDIKTAVQSDAFKKVIEEDFEGFNRPDWMED
ncbi:MULTISPECIES: MetQ/NlpA family ABC transporter substrate-binding protein [Alteribacter]|uniref:Lipoprotein n=1 Tax=Alteribacter keqinensis TaxID=2483800 RepID=A0A3M7TSW2_9BACI|nr:MULTISPECIES: MetQ/NlpA family ABC transporter substrate-binding protein [Alteribacter]MBM7097799.1 hypothetical protein [Alteribacter salitolerans]RNA68728.1 hypothetical protein EBO34_01810 [Alteribacter keqinensis]